jgi:hypothetical protein
MSDDDLIRRGDALALFENYTGTQFWVQQITALPPDDRVAKLVEAANQARLAFAGFVSVQSAVDKLDAALAAWEAGK